MRKRRGHTHRQLEGEQLRQWKICRLIGHRPSGEIRIGHHVCKRCRMLYRKRWDR